MIAKAVTYFWNEKIILICDGCCDKAWGINTRPKVELSDDEDDYEFLTDQELGAAPLDPGTYEGEYGKPTNPLHRLNKWCARECERSTMICPNQDFELSDFTKREKNKGG